nr:type II toxin-antitoxin system HipA family toxin [uncultured Pseudogulbenkiania sp.]
MSDAPVHVWLPGQAASLLAGAFTLDARVSRFHYDDGYREQGGPALAPDMPVSKATHKIAGRDPIFPIMLDSGPDDWGHMLLERRLEREVSRLDALTLGPADGAGNIVLGHLTPERFETMSLAAFQAVLADLPEAQDPASQRHRERVMQSVFQGTSLGGAKPKLTLERDGVQYIAKFPERGDDPFLPQLELAMLRLARDCGINACEAEVIEPAPHRYALLVKRFDRHAQGTGFARTGYVSAWSVARLDQHQEKREDQALLATKGFTPAMYARSYVALAGHMMRWCGGGERYRANLRELWRRIVFNSLIRNTDDHPRNHGLLCGSMDPHQWGLSPAFDMVAQRSAGIVPGHAMAYLFDEPTRGRKHAQRRLVSASSRADLLLAATLHYGYERHEAESVLEEMQGLVRGTWREYLISAGMPAEETDRYAKTLGLDFD